VLVLATTAALGQLSWYGLPALYPVMASQLNLSISQLGLISSAFVIGFGLFQVPAGILAAKIGLRRTVLFGAILVSAFSLAVSLFSNPYEIIGLRLVAGVGMALVYAPGMMLAIRYVGRGAQNLGIGLYSAIGDVGGITGIFGLAVVASRIGWRLSVGISGTLGLIFALLLFGLLPGEGPDPGFQVRTSDLRKVLFSRNLLVISSALLGIECGWNIVVYFIVYYLETQLKVSPGLSGFVGALILAGAILGALMMPQVSGRSRDSKSAFFVLGVVCALSVVLVSAGSLYGAASGTLLEGILNGLTYSFGFVLARKAVPIAQYEALGVAWVSSIAIFGSSWSTLLYPYVVAQSGYSVAWSTCSLLGILFILPVLFLRDRQSPGFLRGSEAR
jgi:MFS family permease